jgi:hypothetical protein
MSSFSGEEVLTASLIPNKAAEVVVPVGEAAGAYEQEEVWTVRQGGEWFPMMPSISAVASVLANLNLVLFLFAYILFKGVHKRTGGFALSKDCFRGWG